jgi:hypothetical protein
MTLRRLVAVTTVVSGMVAAGAIAAAQADPPTTLYLDSYSAADDGAASLTAGTLADGTTYTVTVSGTYSPWDYWGHKRCGRPEPGPVYPSPGRPITPVGDDAVFRFAQAISTPSCPFRHGRFRRLTVFQENYTTSPTSWVPLTPDGGVPSRPAPDTHSYTQTIIGQGAPLQFRLLDSRTSDNDGRLQIVITPTPGP